MSNQIETTESNHDESQWSQGKFIFALLGLALSLVALVTVVAMGYHKFMIAPIDRISADMELQELPGTYTHCREETFHGPINLFHRQADMRVVNESDFPQDITVLMVGSYVAPDHLFEGELAPGEGVTVKLGMPSPVGDGHPIPDVLEDPRKVGVCAVVQG